MGYDLHRPMTLGPLRMHKHSITSQPMCPSLIRQIQNAQHGENGWWKIKEHCRLTYFNEAAHKEKSLCLKLTLIISGSASVSPVNRFLVLRNFLLLYLFSTVEVEVCENRL